jgi:hypothetical protein
MRRHTQTDGWAVQEAFLGAAKGSNNYVNLNGITIITGIKKIGKVLST